MNPFKSYEKTTAFGATFQRFQTQPGRAKGAGPLSAAAPSRGRSADVAGRRLEAEGRGEWDDGQESRVISMEMSDSIYGD